MHDEACPIYDDLIENMLIGHNFIKETFGVKPRIGWQLDPFGHSNTNARLFAEMGFDAWFFARGDWEDKRTRLHKKEMEWVQVPNAESLGSETHILTHWLYHHYSSPEGFSFDINRYDSPWISGNTRDNNEAEEANKLMVLLDERASHYLTDDVLMLMGDDFQYMNAA